METFEEWLAEHEIEIISREREDDRWRYVLRGPEGNEVRTSFTEDELANDPISVMAFIEALFDD